jgi:hypothetical protein
VLLVIDLEDKIGRKAVSIPPDGLIESHRGHAVEPGEVAIEHHPPALYDVDGREIGVGVHIL